MVSASDVLLVEDEPWLGELYTKVLQKANFKVRWLQDAYDAMAAIDEALPDIIVLDLVLPWTNGIQLLNSLASYHDLRTIPIIIFSNAIPKGLKLQSIRHYGVVALLDKAVTNPIALLKVIREVL